MCGINAIYAYHDAAPNPDPKDLRAVRDHMHSRGPDHAGEWWDSHRRIAIGHRRLAIQDLSERANQPMQSHCGRYTIAFNGEIYNKQALQESVTRAGTHLRTNSDTEVLLELFAKEGVRCLPKLRGMYAFAVWDDLEMALYIARDPYGIKPLYVADDGWTLRVSSQVKALIRDPNVSKETCPAGATGFLLWGSVPEPFSIFRDIYPLSPGHYQKVTSSGPQPQTPFQTLLSIYRDLYVTPENPSASIRRAVTESVRAHLISDVPITLFLSAGIDSAAVLQACHYASANLSSVITIDFGEYQGTKDNESQLAARLAREYGIRHHRRVFTREEFIDSLDSILSSMDQPSIDGINTWFASKAASEQGARVALSGLGGDELFKGYPSFRNIPRAASITQAVSRFPLMPQLWDYGMRALGPRSQLHPKISGLLRFGKSWSQLYFLQRALMLPQDAAHHLSADLFKDGLNKLQEANAIYNDAAVRSIPPNSRVSFLESTYYMRNQLLRDSDWASMAHSVELRTPLVDTALLQSAVAVHRKISDKQLFAESMGVPQWISRRAKTGFTTPVSEWLGRELPRLNKHWQRDWANHLLEPYIKHCH